MRDQILRVVEAFLGGIIIAFVVTVVHAVSFPWVVGVGLVVVAAYLLALRLFDPNRITTVAGMLGIVLTIFILAQRSPGGSVLIAATDAGNSWVLGSAFVSGLIAVWPSLSRARKS
jgi:hypothetical protein